MQSETAPNKEDCPHWCGASHRDGVFFHAHRLGTVHLKEGNVGVTLTQIRGEDCVELGFSVEGKDPAVAFFGKSDVRSLRDRLSKALRELGTA